MFAFVRVKSPLDAPVAVVVANVTLSALSSQPINMLSESPLSITKPESLLGAPVVPVPSSISVSAIVVVLELTVVCVPFTVKFPESVTFPVNV